MRASQGFKPWYVGKTTKSFRQECFQTHKLEHYNNVLFKGNNLIIGGPDKDAHYHLLEQQRSEIESDIGEELEWNKLEGKKENHIKLRWYDCDYTDKAHWPEQHEWLYEKLNKFHSAFSQRIKNLRAEDYEPEDKD